MRYRVWIFVFFSALVARGIPSIRLDDLVSAVQQAEKNGDFSLVVQLCEEMLRIKPHWVPAELHLAQAYDSQQRFIEAIPLLDEIIRHDPAMADAYLLRGKEYYEINRYTDAVKSLERAAALQPRNAFVHSYLGAAYYQLHDYGRAANAYLEQVRIQPQESEFYFQLVQSYQGLQRANVQRIEGDPQAGYFALLLEADRNLERQDFTAAGNQARAALAQSPYGPEAWLLLSLLNKKHGETENARTNLAKAARLEDKGPIAFRGLAASESAPSKSCRAASSLADAYCKSAEGDLSTATKLIERAAASAPVSSRRAYWIARIYGRLVQNTVARLVKIAPNSPGLHKLYARAFDENRKRPDAAAEYEKAIAAADQDASTFIEYANFRIRGREFPQAIQLLRRALQLTPYDHNVHVLLAGSYLQDSEPASAVPLFEQVLQTSPGNVQVRIDLAESLYALDRAAEAIRTLEGGLDDPDGRLAYVLSKYYARQGNKEKALAAMEIFRQRQKQTTK